MFEPALFTRLRPASRVLVDGGTDILMRGDEAGLGTPEDMSSLAAVAALPDSLVRLVACLGFGIDSYHGVCHAHVLENLAALQRAGAFSVPPDSPGPRRTWTRSPTRRSPLARLPGIKALVALRPTVRVSGVVSG
jgi:hypothetical protein